MDITAEKISVRSLVENYIDDGDDGVYGYNHRLVLRPKYQREFIYSSKQRNEVINTIRKGFPLGLMYWSKISEDSYECLDGQQRSISICQYINKDFPINIDGNDKFFHNLTKEQQDEILDYELTIYICEGSEEEKLEWFKVINIAGVTLTPQELLNATYTGPWLSDAKNYFSKRNCAAKQMGEGYVKGNPIRQDYLEKVLGWIADKNNLESGQMYMAIHQKDEDANSLWVYYQNVINWARTLFPIERKGITDSQDWGLLYNMYNGKEYNSDELEREIKKLLMDDDVTNKKGVIPYVLSDKTKSDERKLSLRAFTDSQKIRAYEKQNGRCAVCGNEFDIADMQGDHIVPWSQGGRTVDENLQMLCKKCNNEKSNQFVL